MADTRELEEREWQDPANWRLLVFYVARRDPRVIVPKRFGHGVGYTLNFGRPLGWCGDRGVRWRRRWSDHPTVGMLRGRVRRTVQLRVRVPDDEGNATPARAQPGEPHPVRAVTDIVSSPTPSIERTT